MAAIAGCPFWPRSARNRALAGASAIRQAAALFSAAEHQRPLLRGCVREAYVPEAYVPEAYDPEACDPDLRCDRDELRTA